MPKLRDLYGIDLNRLGGYRPEYTSVMERPLTDFEREQRAAPIDRPYASGQLEAPMFAPDDLIGSGIPTKLAALAKGSIPAIAGIIKPKGGVWTRPPNSASDYMISTLGKKDRQLADIDPRYGFAADRVRLQTLDKYPPQESLDDLLDLYQQVNWRDYKRQHLRTNRLPETSDDLRANPKWIPIIKRAITRDRIKQHLVDPSKYPELSADPEIAVKAWERGPLVSYLRNKLGTMDDPLRMLAEEGVTHIKNPTETAKLSILGGLRGKRIAAGMPAEDQGQSSLAKIWERMADSSIQSAGVDSYGNPVRFLRAIHLGDLVDDVPTAIEQSIRQGKVGATSVAGGHYSLEDAIRDIHKQNVLSQDVYRNATVFKEYPESGHKWVRLDKPGQFNTESDLMRHSVRGYEAMPEYGLGGPEAIKSGKAEIYSLRTKEGKPKVTVEVDNSDPSNPVISQVKGFADILDLPPQIEALVQDFAKTRNVPIRGR